jgi:DNA-binding NarL/FixJ family response regulator
VLTLIGQGCRTLRSQLTLSAATVKTHVSRLLMRLHARDRAQQVIAAYKSSLAQPRGSKTS